MDEARWRRQGAIDWGLPKNQYDWVGLYNKGSNNKDYIDYQYIEGKKKGKLTFVGINVIGDYNARLFFDDSYTRESLVPFSIAK